MSVCACGHLLREHATRDGVCLGRVPARRSSLRRRLLPCPCVRPTPLAGVVGIQTTLDDGEDLLRRRA